MFSAILKGSWRGQLVCPFVPSTLGAQSLSEEDTHVFLTCGIRTVLGCSDLIRCRKSCTVHSLKIIFILILFHSCKQQCILADWNCQLWQAKANEGQLSQSISTGLNYNNFFTQIRAGILLADVFLQFCVCFSVFRSWTLDVFWFDAILDKISESNREGRFQNLVWPFEIGSLGMRWGRRNAHQEIFLGNL